jgi:2-iminobutanoate/2-iminopropanoate deaminase
VGKGNMRAQIEQVGENIKSCFAAVAVSLAEIVKTDAYVTDFDEFQRRAIRSRYFGAARRPAGRSRSAASPAPIS